MDDLQHHGILGQKWGVRRYQNKDGSLTAAGRKKEAADLRKKAQKVASRSPLNTQDSDLKRAKYMSNSAPIRVGKTAASLIAQTVVADVLSGDISKYSTMSKSDIFKKVSGIAALTAGNTLLNDALAKSALKNYDNKGKQTTKGRGNKLLTKEDKISLGINFGTRAAYVAAKVGKLKLGAIAADRAKNEARVRSWGNNLLGQNSNYSTVWTDGDVSVLDKIRR